MKKGMWKLFLLELRRQWTVAAIFIPLALAALSFLTFLTAARFAKVYDAAQNAGNANLSLVIPLATCLFAVGIVAADVKDGWLRTLLIRPVARQNYLLIKMAAVYSCVVFTIVVAGILPNLVVMNFFVKGEVRFDLGHFLLIHVLILLQAMLYLSLLTFFSCWLPGAFNVVSLAVWGLAASLIGAYIQVVYGMNKWLVILKDYLFPSGFWDAVDAINAGQPTPIAQIMWGLAALSLALALAFWSITKIQVDKSSE